jgi:large subunit ribosomal protein L7/L12
MSEVKLSKNAEKIVELIEGLNVLELNDLVKHLEDKFDVQASMPMMMGAMPAAGGAAEAVEEKTEFNVVLTDAGAKKIAVIKAVRELNPTLGLVDAKKMVETLPAVLMEDAKKEDAEAAKAKLEEAGAKVELK